MNTLITGASSGIGEALALASATRGDTLFICGRDRIRLEDVAARCRAAGAPRVRADAVDVADEDATRAWIESCDREAPLERVFANAGVSTGDETEENSRRTFAINVGGVVNTVHPALAAMRRHGGGQIVLTASIAGYGPLKACPAYSATKACVKTWGLALRGQLAREKIRVSVVCPGFVRSRMTDGNTCPMPFFMEADRAAKTILARADRNVGLIAFPWPMRLATWWLSTLPFRLNEAVNRLLPAKVIALLLAALPCLFANAAEPIAERIFRPARLTRGNTNLMVVQPIDTASWIWSADDAGAGARARGITHDAQVDRKVSNVFVFRKTFEVKTNDVPPVIDVSADERFYLTCDGAFVARGPNRADVENWQYQTYRLNLKPGQHELRAVVTRLGEHAPLAQLSYRGGFILKADGAYDARLTTGRADWEIGRFDGMRPNGSDNGVWGTGSQFIVEGSGPFAVEPKAWTKPVVVRGPASRETHTAGCGGRTPGWMLFPAQLPDQTEAVVRPGAFRAATTAAKWRANHVYAEEDARAPIVADFNRLLRGEAKEVTVPARTRLQLAWHLGRYICAYPEAVLAKGRGARFSWTFAESTRNVSDRRKGDRAEIVGKYLEGYGETFFADGRENAVFSAPWFRCGLWSRLDIATADEPLVIRDLRLVESRYPLEMESAFESPDDPSLGGIRAICARAMQMCCHEMLFDCPYYEQQMYPGDTRVQLLVLSALSRDDRIVKRAMEIFDLGTRDDGQCPFNWPTRGTQEGFTYTLCYLAMFGDYAMNHADFAWLRARLPGLRKSMAGCELYENAEGLVENTPGWNFMDWTTEWNASSVPNSRAGQDCNSFANLFWLLAMQSAATTERALGNELQAQYWERKAARLKQAIVAAFWDDGRGLLADTKAKKTFSEHSQALAILTDCLPTGKRDVCFRHLVEDKDLARTTVYFNYYLFEAYFKMGRADLFLKRLDLWRGYVARHITTLSEMPDTPRMEGRSDCHAWGAHPIWFMQTGLAGIRSAAPGFAKVLVAPQPGSLKSLKARHPHPQGWIEIDLAFDGAGAHGTVATPVAGEFRYGGKSVPIKPGSNSL